jgi:hypothetical protein
MHRRAFLIGSTAATAGCLLLPAVSTAQRHKHTNWYLRRLRPLDHLVPIYVATGLCRVDVVTLRQTALAIMGDDPQPTTLRQHRDQLVDQIPKLYQVAFGALPTLVQVAQTIRLYLAEYHPPQVVWFKRDGDGVAWAQGTYYPNWEVIGTDPNVVNESNTLQMSAGMTPPVAITCAMAAAAAGESFEAGSVTAGTVASLIGAISTAEGTLTAAALTFSAFSIGIATLGLISIGIGFIALCLSLGREDGSAPSTSNADSADCTSSEACE